MNRKDVYNEIVELLNKKLEEHQNYPHQFIVVYYKHSDDSVIGYHASTFCQTVKYALEAKRYAAEDPYPQLKTIYSNLKYALSKEAVTDNIFAETFKKTQEAFKGLNLSDIYIDAVYLTEGTPKQEFRYAIIQND